ncbi:hypothetical protein [Sphingobium nicotianae]|uniref:MobA-like NTP transferase domain-containing protein n=1 Tax=Sphingobium nicotianae TaxID=2782607 RepID=A0A9X1AK85_9SPHN|nr:hypothetical protein [Sphingobium nicotianae]MBT2185828.1 hypothetical protein [Sphingobium nicotianae]
MALIALLSARDGARNRTAGGLAAPLIDFGGQPLLEYQARQALAAGADKIVILVDAPAPDLAQLVDRLSAEQERPVALVQDMTTLSRAIALDDRVLLLSENLVAPPEALTSLLATPASTMLTLPSVPSTARFERIDSGAMWAGALWAPGANIVSTLDMLGDWDLELTLLRRAVQAGILRVELSPELVMDGRLTIARDQASADLALHALSEGRHATVSEGASGLGSLFVPVSRLIVRELVRRQIEPAHLAMIALFLAVAGLALSVTGWALPGLIVTIMAVAASDLARQSAMVTLRTSGRPWQHRVVQGGGLLVLAILGLRLSQGQLLGLAGAWLPLILIGLLAWADEIERPVGPWRRWLQLTVPGALVLVLIGQIFGGAAASFALLGLLVCAAIAVRLLPIDSARV